MLQTCTCIATGALQGTRATNRLWQLQHQAWLGMPFPRCSLFVCHVTRAAVIFVSRINHSSAVGADMLLTCAFRHDGPLLVAQLYIHTFNATMVTNSLYAYVYCAGIHSWAIPQVHMRSLLVTCPTGQVLVGSNCQWCPDGKIESSGICVDGSSCEPGHRANQGVCKNCPGGQVPRGRTDRTACVWSPDSGVQTALSSTHRALTLHRMPTPAPRCLRQLASLLTVCVAVAAGPTRACARCAATVPPVPPVLAVWPVLLERQL